MREPFPERKLNSTTIRRAVFVNLFKLGWDVRDVQLFAGHHYASTTERYKPTDLSEMEEGLASTITDVGKYSIKDEDGQFYCHALKGMY